MEQSIASSPPTLVAEIIGKLPDRHSAGTVAGGVARFCTAVSKTLVVVKVMVKLYFLLEFKESSI